DPRAHRGPRRARAQGVRRRPRPRRAGAPRAGRQDRDPAVPVRGCVHPAQPGAREVRGSQLPRAVRL
ncbi:MAG: hypothetical protein AVDCRST_MAG85-1699, partial [uncultured Solirubrobacteraceae bacterium]